MPAQHTPGPWQISRSSAGKNGTSLTIWRNDEGPNSKAETNSNWRCIAQHVHMEADARLIAAAPDLLSALQDVLPYARACIGLPESAWPSDSVILKARAAIAKAEGW